MGPSMTCCLKSLGRPAIFGLLLWNLTRNTHYGDFSANLSHGLTVSTCLPNVQNTIRSWTLSVHRQLLMCEKQQSILPLIDNKRAYWLYLSLLNYVIMTAWIFWEKDCFTLTCPLKWSMFGLIWISYKQWVFFLV